MLSNFKGCQGKREKIKKTDLTSDCYLEIGSLTPLAVREGRLLDSLLLPSSSASASDWAATSSLSVELSSLETGVPSFLAAL